MKAYKKLIIAISILITLGIVSTVIAAYTTHTAITDVTITSPSDNTIVFAGKTYTDFFACTTSTDNDCNTSTQQVEADTVTHTWSGAGTITPLTGTTGIDWTAPAAPGDTVITVTADDSPLADDTAKTDTVTVKVQKMIYVDEDATAGNDDGTTWANAFLKLQDALAIATSDNEIWVAEGTYYPDEGTGHTDNSRTETFQLITSVEIYGGFDPTTGDDLWSERDYVNNVTTLSGAIGTAADTDNSYYVVTGSGVSTSAVLDGFIITKGYANGTSPTSTFYGGGLYNSVGSPTVNNCTFSNNSAKNGGAIRNVGVSTLTISNCTFSDNSAINGGGGAISNYYADVTATDCTFSGNSATGKGGAIVNTNNSDITLTGCKFINNSATTANAEGGAIASDVNCDLVLTDCLFSGNSAGSHGGAISMISSGTATLTNCVVTGNTADVDGGGIYIWNNRTATLKNCIVTGNTADNDDSGGGNGDGGDGGGICIKESDVDVINSTFTNNSADMYGGGIFEDGSASTTTVTNSICWDNSATSYPQVNNDSVNGVTVTYSNIEGGFSGTGNINSTPNFNDPNDPDGADNTWVTSDDGLNLTSSSPLDNANGNVDPTTDILGNSRYDDTGTTDTGTGTPTYVDMGAYEYQP